MAEFDNRSFKNVNVIFGVIQMEGFAEGDDVVDIESDTEQFSDIAGAKGDVVRTQTNDNRCTITVKLLETSKTNKLLNAVHMADKEVGTGVLPLIIADKEKNETYVINNSWITKIPKVTRGQGPNTMSWVFRGDFLLPIML